MNTSGSGSEDGCDGCQASAEPDEGGQSQRGSLLLVEEVNDTRDRHAKARMGMTLVHIYCTPRHARHYYAISCPRGALTRCPHAPSS